MFKRAYKALLFALIAFSPGITHAVEKSYFTQGQFRNSVSTVMMRIDMDGNIIPGRNILSDLGESTHAWRTGYFGSIDVASGILNVHETFVNLSSGSLMGLRNNGFSVSTITLMNSASTYFDNDVLQTTGAPRNLIVFSTGDNGNTTAQLSTSVLVGCVTFYGIDNKGNPVTEAIFFSTSVPSYANSTSTILNYQPSPGTVFGGTETARVLGVGNVAWAYISSFTVQVTSISGGGGGNGYSPLNATIAIGFGNKIGLANSISNVSDVYKIAAAGGSGGYSNGVINPSLSINTALDTVVFPFIASGNVPGSVSNVLPNGLTTIEVWYRVRRMIP